ncbi:hypothetical protein EDD21DRAFT_352146 [Dissophora ornata]|nr:hypothetical protein BGZ58_006385 [Dissophora ornata]KAI8603128.1 hypothetical protein EDD21DRAFT_352146 [Dissophora ornata]
MNRVKDIEDTAMTNLSKIREHVQFIRQADFEPTTYKRYGFVHSGRQISSIVARSQVKRTSFSQIQATLVECLTPQITSTVRGVDYHLTEVRTVVKTQQDVTDL